MSTETAPVQGVEQRQFYKAVRPDGTAFADDTFAWDPIPGGITAHHDPENDADASHYLSVATVPTDCTAFRWPCRLLLVEPIGYEDLPEVWTPHPTEYPNKRAVAATKTVAELPAHEVFGPQGEHVAALLHRLANLTPQEALALAAAWDAARAAAWDAARAAAWDAARAAARAAAWDAARAAAWDAAWAAAWDAAWAAAGLLARDLIDDETYRRLTYLAAGVLGPLHPDDDPVAVCVHEDGWEHPTLGDLDEACSQVRPSWVPVPA